MRTGPTVTEGREKEVPLKTIDVEFTQESFYIMSIYGLWGKKGTKDTVI